MVLRIVQKKPQRQPFRFLNVWMRHPKFESIVKENWNKRVEGSTMFRVNQKLKQMKSYFPKLHATEFANIIEKITEAEAELQMI